MNKWIIGLALANVVVLGACAPAPQPAAEPVAEPVVDTAADEAAIRAISSSITESLNAADMESFAAVFSDDVMVMSPNRAAFHGPEEVSAFFGDMLQAFKVNYVTTSEEVVVAGDFAYEVIKTSLTAVVTGEGESVSENSRGIRIYQRQADGSWKIHRYIWAMDGTGMASNTAE